MKRGPVGTNQLELKLFFRDARNRRAALGWDYELTAVSIKAAMINITQDTAATVLVEFNPTTSILRIKPTESAIGRNELKIIFNQTSPVGNVITREITAKIHVHKQLDEWCNLKNR